MSQEILCSEDDDISVMRDIIDRAPNFGFVTFNKKAVSRVEGSGTSICYYYGQSRFIEKKANSAIFWGGKGMKVEIPYSCGVVCLDMGTTPDARNITDKGDIWWTTCWVSLNLARDIKTAELCMLENRIKRPVAFVGTHPKRKPMLFHAVGVGFIDETDATLFRMNSERYPQLYGRR